MNTKLLMLLVVPMEMLILHTYLLVPVEEVEMNARVAAGVVRSRSYLREPSQLVQVSGLMEVQEEHVGMKLVEVVVQVQVELFI